MSDFACALAEALESCWAAQARRSQLPPPGEWRVWLLVAGRGYGKTRAGAEWINAQAQSGAAGARIALVAPTAADARDVMVEGESGILATAPSWARPLYEPSRRRVSWPNGAVGMLFSADEPERLRGPQHSSAWCDELGAWRYPEARHMLLFGLRLGTDPRVLVTTTPRPTQLIRELIARKDAVITRGKTIENREHLPAAFLEQIVHRYEGTRLGRQELDAELLDDVPGALWTRDQIEQSRREAAPVLARIVVAIDPAASSGENADETGVIVAGTDTGGHGYVLADLSGRYAPVEWARIAIKAYRAYTADRVVAEVNNGGEMVEATLRIVDPNISYRAVHASRGKARRAEPISALYEQGRIHHVGTFPQLEDQLCSLTPNFDRRLAGYSPDRADALVWALTDLMIEPMNSFGIFELYRQLAEEARQR